LVALREPSSSRSLLYSCRHPRWVDDLERDTRCHVPADLKLPHVTAWIQVESFEVQNESGVQRSSGSKAWGPPKLQISLGFDRSGLAVGPHGPRRRWFRGCAGTPAGDLSPQARWPSALPLSAPKSRTRHERRSVEGPFSEVSPALKSISGASGSGCPLIVIRAANVRARGDHANTRYHRLLLRAHVRTAAVGSFVPSPSGVVAAVRVEAEPVV
jgi:hypothetical protein